MLSRLLSHSLVVVSQIVPRRRVPELEQAQPRGQVPELELEPELFADAAPGQPTPSPELEELYRGFEKDLLVPLWTEIGDLMPAHPRSRAVPHVWRWQNLLRLAEQAGQIVPVPARSAEAGPLGELHTQDEAVRANATLEGIARISAERKLKGLRDGAAADGTTSVNSDDLTLDGALETRSKYA